MKRQSQASALEGFPVRIRIRGRLDPGWSAWFDGLAVEVRVDGETCLSGTVCDQAALHGLLARIRDLGLPLVGLEVGETDRGLEPAAHGRQTERRGFDERDPDVPH